MVGIGGKGGGVGQILVAVAAALFIRLFTGPGPALLPENETEEDETPDDDQAQVTGKISPVVIRWTNITCSLSDKSSKSVSSFSVYT